MFQYQNIPTCSKSKKYQSCVNIYSNIQKEKNTLIMKKHWCESISFLYKKQYIVGFSGSKSLFASTGNAASVQPSSSVSNRCGVIFQTTLTKGWAGHMVISKAEMMNLFQLFYSWKNSFPVIFHTLGRNFMRRKFWEKKHLENPSTKLSQISYFCWDFAFYKFSCLPKQLEKI